MAARNRITPSIFNNTFHTKTASPGDPPVVLFGYDSSPFTQKIRLALRAKQIPYSMICVSSMMPRPILKENLNITYRKIPVLAIGKEVYVDTSIIVEALEHWFPVSRGYGALYPPTRGGKGRTMQGLVRGIASFWTDRPLFRVATGLIPGTVWKTAFGKDRDGLIGHKLDAEKLAQKIPSNLSAMDTQLSLLEGVLEEATEDWPWVLETRVPGLVDISFYYQLEWAEKISRGVGTGNLTGNEAVEGIGEGMRVVFSEERYPKVFAWFERMGKYVDGLPLLEKKVERNNAKGIEKVLGLLHGMKADRNIDLISTPTTQHKQLNERNGLTMGAHVEVTPDDTGRGDPSRGYLEALSPEEIVITPQEVSTSGNAVQGIRLHFPRIGFVVKPVRASGARL